MALELRAFKPRGVCAINPRAFGSLFAQVEASEVAQHDAVAVVHVTGPIDQHGCWWTSQETIAADVDRACESTSSVVVLRLATPGGVVAGMLEAARDVRRKVEAAGKRLIAYIDGECCSAGYAYASVCHEIYAGPSAIVGSIGVIASLFDESAALQQDGYRVVLVTSGARKADGNPSVPVSDESVAAVQAEVDALAAEFFSHVAEFRGLAAEQVAALQAGVFTGRTALGLKLVDAVGTFDETITALASPTGKLGAPQMNAYEKAKAALAEAAEGEDANAEAAKRALAALDGGGESEDEETTDPGAETAPETEPDEETTDPGSNSASASKAIAEAMRIANAAKAESAKLAAQLAKRDNEAKRDALIASRTDLEPKTKAWLGKQTLAQVESFLADVGAPPATPSAQVLAGVNGGAAPVITAQVGDDEAYKRLPVEQQRAFDNAFGKPGVGTPQATISGNSISLSAVRR
jgi:signal peptide peptidase SppA